MTIPANAPGLVAQTSWSADLHALELEGADAGTPTTTLELLPLQFGDRVVHYEALLKLGQPLTPGSTYRLKASNRCVGSNDAGVQNHEQVVTFTAGAAAPLPSSIGSLQVSYRSGVLGSRAGLTEWSPPSTSDGDVPVSIAQIAIQPSAELTPYLPVTRFSTYVDGEIWGQSHYGRSTTFESNAELATIRDFTRVFTSCGRTPQSSRCEPGAATPGSHEVEIRAHIAGATTDPPPVRVQINLSCADGGAPDSGAPGDAGGSGGSGGMGNNPADSGAHVGNSSATNDGGAGCSVARKPSRAGNRAGLVTLPWIAALLATWRRRARANAAAS